MTVAVDRAFRYLLVGITCAAINNALLIGLDFAGIHYVVAAIISAVVLIPLSYALHLHFTYAVAPRWSAFWRYTSALALNPLFSWGILFLVHDLGGVAMLWAAPIMTALLFMWNFLASNWAILFSRSCNSKEHS